MKIKRAACYTFMILMGLVSVGPNLFAASVSISPSAVINDYTGKVSVSISGLTVGKTVLVERFVDLNGNGTVDAGQDKLTFSGKVTDGQVSLIGGVRNVNVPGDDDGASNGAIRIDLPFPNIDGVFTSAATKSIFRVSDPQNTFTPVTAVFQVSQKVESQGVSGQITAASGGAPLSGAFVVLSPSGGGSPLAAVLTDVNGNYSFFTPPGSFVVFVVQTGFVSDQSTGAVTVVVNQFATKNLALASAGFTLSGKVSDSSSTAGVGGVLVSANSINNLFAGGLTDASGNYSFKVTAGQWEIRPDKGPLAQLGYLTPKKLTINTTANGSATNNFPVSKATALIYGNVTDGANPVNGLQIKVNDQGNLFNSQGVTFAPGGNYVVGLVAGTWGVEPDSDSLNQRGYTGGTGSEVTLTAGQAVQVDFVLQAITAHLRGQITDNDGFPLTGMTIVVQPIPSNPSGTGSLNPKTDNNGNFDVGVRGGTWEIALECVEAQQRGYVDIYGIDFNVTDGVDQNNIGLAFPVFTATISGSVKDNLGHPIPGVEVDAGQDINGSVSYGPGCVSTDNNGNYTLKVLGGNWDVSPNSNDLNARGFNDAGSQNVAISNGTATANFVATQLPPIITGPLTATATVGQLFVYQVTATGLPDTYGATPIPPNLSFDTVIGIIGGVPTTPGTTQVQLSATNSMGTGSATLTITVQPAPVSGPAIISGTSITARTGQPFSFRVLTKNTSPSARLNASDVPPGLHADPMTGIISGTPTSDGGFGVTLTVTDGAATTEGILQITCVSDPAFPVITSAGGATLTPGKFFSYTITTPGDPDPSDPTSFSIIGALPAGLSFNAQTGTISGTYTPVAHALSNRAQSQMSAGNGDEAGGRLERGVPLLNETPPVGITGLVTHNKKGTGTKPLNYFSPTAIPTIGVSVSSSSVNEGASADFIFSTSIVDPVNAKTVLYKISGKAKSGTDYTLSGSSVIPAGASSVALTLTALTDAVPKEKNETVTMTLSKVAKTAPYTLSSAKKVSMTIVNVP